MPRRANSLKERVNRESRDKNSSQQRGITYEGSTKCERETSGKKNKLRWLVQEKSLRCVEEIVN